jgi:uncharacterized membrane protein YeaQ/YmgE (transglycosylase-associated protein family)
MPRARKLSFGGYPQENELLSLRDIIDLCTFSESEARAISGVSEEVDCFMRDLTIVIRPIKCAGAQTYNFEDLTVQKEVPFSYSIRD